MASLITPVTTTSPVTFSHPLSIKLDDSNFLLWNQQVEAIIAAHKLHRYAVNPQIPQQFASESNRLLGVQTEEYERWYVQD